MDFQFPPIPSELQSFDEAQPQHIKYVIALLLSLSWWTVPA